MKRKKKKVTLNTPKRIALGVLLVLVVTALYFSVTLITDYSRGSLSGSTKTVTVSRHASTSDIAATLERNGVIKNGFFFRICSRMMGYDGKYNEGSFEIARGSGYADIMKQLTETTGVQKDYVTIPEGYTTEQIADAVALMGNYTAEGFLAAASEDYDFDFLPKTARKDHLEGYLFPDTYNFTENDTPKIMVNAMLKRFGTIFSDKYKARAAELGMSLDEVVILASIIEAEAGSDADRPKISGVFHNRLKDKTYPYLESCATIQYILGERKPILSNADTRIDSPYNTYINKGLPVGPICNPGKASIEAALYPEESDFMYFQSDASGKIYYAKTLEEHEKIRREIQ